MEDEVERSIALLREANVSLAHGMSELELERVEHRLGFSFCEVHRRLLAAALPLGPGPGRTTPWPDWRSGAAEDLHTRLGWPVDGVLFDVRNNAFWPRSWGTRPLAAADAEALARDQLASVPVMVPLYGHRYLPAGPVFEAPAVFSIYQTDVIYYGDSLVDWAAYEFLGRRSPSPMERGRRTPFWSDLAEGAEPADL